MFRFFYSTLVASLDLSHRYLLLSGADGCRMQLVVLPLRLLFWHTVGGHILMMLVFYLKSDVCILMKLPADVHMADRFFLVDRYKFLQSNPLSMFVDCLSYFEREIRHLSQWLGWYEMKLYLLCYLKW